VPTFTLRDESVTPLTSILRVIVVEAEVSNLVVRHISLVGESDITLHEEPSLKVKLNALPSVKVCGRPVPTICKIVPPTGLRSVFGLTLEIMRPTVMFTHEGSTGTVPMESITTGAQFPATGVTVHVIYV